jgi:hypothetical protein
LSSSYDTKSRQQPSNDTKLQPSSNCNNNNNNNNNNSNNDTILIINKAPVTGTNVSRTARKAISKVLGMTHTTKYDTTSTRLNISIAHETSMDKNLISKYDATENHVSTGIPTTVLKSCESSQMGSKILITHENLTHFHMP